MKKIVGVLAVVIILGLVGIFYWKNSNQTQTKVIKIGVIMPLTGPAAQIGQDILSGIETAEKQFKNPASLGDSIKLIIEDSKVDPKTCVSIAEKLINVDKVDFIIGPASSGEALALAPICQKYKIPMLSPTASTPSLTNAGEYIFRIYPTDVYDGEILSGIAVDKLKLKKLAVFYLNNDYGTGLKNVFSQEILRKGSIVNCESGFSESEIDFKTIVSKLKAEKSDGVFIVALVDQYIKILKLIKEQNIKVKILAPVTFDDELIYKRNGAISEGVIYSRPYFNIYASDTIVHNFVSVYEKEKGKKPSILSALGYDSYMLTMNLFQRNSFKKENIIQSFNGIKDYNGASGIINFDKNGDVIKKLEIMTIKNSNAVKYE